jgi:hypothetical protein
LMSSQVKIFVFTVKWKYKKSAQSVLLFSSQTKNKKLMQKFLLLINLIPSTMSVFLKLIIFDVVIAIVKFIYLV